MRQRETRKPAIPTAEEVEAIIPIIRAAFAGQGIEMTSLGGHPQGGVMAVASMADAQKAALVGRLFEDGIVMAETQRDTFGFAVMR